MLEPFPVSLALSLLPEDEQIVRTAMHCASCFGDPVGDGNGAKANDRWLLFVIYFI